MQIISKIIVLVVYILFLYGMYRFYTYYFNKPDVIARRVAKAKLPQWLNAIERLVLTFSLLLFFYLFLIIFIYFSKLYPLGPNAMIFAALAVVFAAIPFAPLLSNIIFWIIPYTRKIMSDGAVGVPGASFRESNIGILKFALIIEPICILIIILAFTFK